ncbi:MAG: DUF4160 domain-containing protein [Actinomycetota bacterium]
MPTVLVSGPYRVFFYSGDRLEPPHVHVERDWMVAKFWLIPARLQDPDGFSQAELRRVRRLIENHAQSLLESWNEFFTG